MNTKTETHEQERAFVINRLSDEMAYLEQQLEAVKGEGESKEYRALLKSYTDTAKLYLRLVSEDEIEQDKADALTDFNTPSVYDKRGILTI
jgi:geranylgeranyl pyrophosphate synthase